MYHSLHAVVEDVNSLLSGSSNALQCFESPSKEQIAQLIRQGNRSHDWNRVFLSNTFSQKNGEILLNRIHSCSFNGTIYLFEQSGLVKLQEDIEVDAELFECHFFGVCFVRKDCYLSNNGVLKNIYIGEGTSIVNCGRLIGDENAKYGEVSVQLGSEAKVIPNAKNGRTVQFSPSTGITLTTAFNGALHFNTLVSKVDDASALRISVPMCLIADHCILSGCNTIYNAFLGSFSTASSSEIKNTTIFSSQQHPSCVASACVTESVISESCHVLSGASLENVCMFQNSSASEKAHIVHSILAPDSSISLGECYHSFLGSFVGFHHQSLLISCLWPLGRGNIGYGAMIGANHSGRSNDQECWMGEGCFIGLNSAIKFPCNLMLAPYSIVAAGTTCLPQMVSFPFSLICSPDAYIISEHVSPALNCLKPGWVLNNNQYFIERSVKKFLSRRKSMDFITDFPIFRPTTANMVRSSRAGLLALLSRGSSVVNISCERIFTDRQYSGLGKCFLSETEAQLAVAAYTTFLKRYALHGLLYFLMRVVSEAYIPKLEYDTDLLTIVQNISESTSVFGELEADVSLHLQDIKMDMVCVDQSKISAKEVTNSINNATSAEDSTEKVALVDRFNALLDRTDTFVLLTNSFHSEVLHHQLEILLHEYQGQLTKDVLLLLISTAASREVSSLTARSDAVSTAKNLLNELIGIEEIYSSNVLDSKHKDNVRSMKVIPDYCDFFFDQTEQSASSIGEKLEAIKTITKDNDPTICAAIRRKNEIIESVKLIFTLIDQKKNN